MARLFVYGVNQRCPEDLLRSEFEKCGEVSDVFITGKGYAFVTMADDEGASNAIRDLNGYTIDGQNIKVDTARKRDDDGGSGGGGGGGGGRSSSYSRGRGGFRGRGGYDDGGRRGGYGDSRGRGGTNRGCYECGQEGHMAKMCPQRSGNGN